MVVAVVVVVVVVVVGVAGGSGSVAVVAAAVAAAVVLAVVVVVVVVAVAAGVAGGGGAAATAIVLPKPQNLNPCFQQLQALFGTNQYPHCLGQISCSNLFASPGMWTSSAGGGGGLCRSHNLAGGNASERHPQLLHSSENPEP